MTTPTTTPTNLTSFSTIKVEIPKGVKMMLSTMGIDAEKIQDALNVALASGAIEKLATLPETLQKIETKLEFLIERQSGTKIFEDWLARRK